MVKCYGVVWCGEVWLEFRVWGLGVVNYYGVLWCGEARCGEVERFGVVWCQDTQQLRADVDRETASQ